MKKKINKKKRKNKKMTEKKNTVVLIIKENVKYNHLVVKNGLDVDCVMVIIIFIFFILL